MHQYFQELKQQLIDEHFIVDNQLLEKQEAQASIIAFPCEFTIKVMGQSNALFEKTVLNIVREHYPKLAKQSIQKKHSKAKKYLSLSITVYAQSKAELDALYQDLSSCPDVLMVL